MLRRCTVWCPESQIIFLHIDDGSSREFCARSAARLDLTDVCVRVRREEMTWRVLAEQEIEWMCDANATYCRCPTTNDFVSTTATNRAQSFPLNI